MYIIVLKQSYSGTRAVFFLIPLLRIANIDLIKTPVLCLPETLSWLCNPKKQRSIWCKYLVSERSQQPVIMDPPTSRTGILSCLIFENPLNIASSNVGCTTAPPCRCLAPLVGLCYSDGSCIPVHSYSSIYCYKFKLVFSGYRENNTSSWYELTYPNMSSLKARTIETIWTELI